MRIVMLLPMGIDRPSGRRYFNLARGMVAGGDAVRLLALHPDLVNCPQRRFVRDGVEVWYVGQMHARKSTGVPTRFSAIALLRVLITATIGMLWGIICSPADAYHLGKPQPINGLAALLGIGLLRRRRFYVDCDDDEVGSNRLTSAWQRSIFAFWQTWLPRSACGVTVNTRFLLTRMTNQGITPVVYVPNGVDLAIWQAPVAAQQRALRHAFGLDGRRVIAYVGTLALHNHPVDLLLAAYEVVAAQHADVDLILIGGGEDMALLRREIVQRGLERRVVMFGQVDHAQIPALLALAEFSVDPVIDNPVARARSPLKIFESMALGVPVVTGDTGDRAELLDHGRAGVLVPAGDHLALARAFQALLDDPARRTQLADAAKVYVLHYAWPVLAQQWREVYHAA